MSEALQRHIGPMPTWLMFSGTTIGIVGASVTKHAESVGEFVVALDIRADTSNLGAGAYFWDVAAADSSACVGPV
jgi:hypothetical protein